jgi:hypothetical protein
VSDAPIARNACTAGRSLRLPNVPDASGNHFICQRCRLRVSVINAKIGRALIRSENARCPFGVVCAIVAVMYYDAERLIADIHGGLQHSHAAAVPASVIFC